MPTLTSAPPIRHVYVHVPFCDGKCAYCGFYSIRYTPRLADAYLDALEREIGLFADGGGAIQAATAYIGGGTPSVLSAAQLSRLGAVVRGVCRGDPAEWTVECNPGTLDAAKARVLREAGVNRVSLGAQAFQDHVLRRIGRRHDAAAIGEAAGFLRGVGLTNIGVDLIAGLPRVKAGPWRESLQAAIALRPRHVSVYGLTLEPRTPLAQQARDGQVRLPGEAAQLRLLAEAGRLLGRAGFDHYETSNYALPGFACRHNVACWEGYDYVGFGPAASSRVGRERWTNRADVKGYVGALRRARLPPRRLERLSAVRDATERLIFGFRLRAGVNLHTFCERVGPVAGELQPEWERTLARLRLMGHVRREGGRWWLTARGRLMADGVAEALIPS